MIKLAFYVRRDIMAYIKTREGSNFSTNQKEFFSDETDNFL